MDGLDGGWRAFWCDPQRAPAWCAEDPVLAGLPSLAEWARAHGTRPGQPTLLHSDGRLVPEVNAFFASPRMRVCAAGTVRKYAYALGIWLGFWTRSAGPGTRSARRTSTGSSSGG